MTSSLVGAPEEAAFETFNPALVRAWANRSTPNWMRGLAPGSVVMDTDSAGSGTCRRTNASGMVNNARFMMMKRSEPRDLCVAVYDSFPHPLDTNGDVRLSREFNLTPIQVCENVIVP